MPVERGLTLCHLRACKSSMPPLTPLLSNKSMRMDVSFAVGMMPVEQVPDLC